MKVLQTSKLPIRQSESLQSQSGGKSRKKLNPYRILVAETTAKLAISSVLAIAAIAALARIIPNTVARQEDLKELQSEVQSTQERVTSLKTSFGRYFDPLQARSVMQEQSHRVDATQRPVIWIKNGVPLNQGILPKP